MWQSGCFPYFLLCSFSSEATAASELKLPNFHLLPCPDKFLKKNKKKQIKTLWQTAVIHDSGSLNLEHISAETYWCYGEAHVDAPWSTVVLQELLTRPWTLTLSWRHRVQQRREVFARRDILGWRKTYVKALDDRCVGAYLNGRKTKSFRRQFCSKANLIIKI